MVWRNKHRAGRRKRERIAASKKQPTIIAVEKGYFLSDRTKQQLQRAAWRARHLNLPDDPNTEIIDLTQEPEENSNLENIEQIKTTQTVYTATVTKLFTRIEQHLLTIGYMKETNDQ